MQFIVLILAITIVILKIMGWGITIGLFASLLSWLVGQDLWLDRSLLLLKWSFIIFMVFAVIHVVIDCVIKKFLNNK